MNIFLDTSSLFKLYHKEAGTEELEQLFVKQNIRRVFLAEITMIEFTSVVWRRCRMKEVELEKAEALLRAFENDQKKFHFISDDATVKAKASMLISNYWKSGLRTLDSIQLASALVEKDNLQLFHTSDFILKDLAEKECLNVNKTP